MEDIALETIESLKEYLPRLIEGCRIAAEDLQAGNEATALQAIPLITEGLEWVVQAVVGLQELGQLKNLDASELTQHFEQMISALEIKDYILLADTLEYEIVPALEGWAENVGVPH